MSPLPYVNNRWHAALAYQDRSAVDANPGVKITILSEDETRSREVNVDDGEREGEAGTENDLVPGGGLIVLACSFLAFATC